MKLALILMAALLVAGPLAAQTPSSARLEAADGLLAVMDMEKMMEETFEESFAAQNRMLATMGGSPGTDSLLAAMQEISRKYVSRALEWSSLRDDVALMYAETFTAEELRELEAFYRSPVGRHLLEATPRLTAGIQEITSRRMQTFMPQLMEEVMERMGVGPKTGGGGS